MKYSHNRPRRTSLLLALIGGIFCAGLLLFAPDLQAAPDPTKAFNEARAGVGALEKDAKRSQHRDQWLGYVEIFDKLYADNPQWKNRAAALYRSAHACDNLARRSRITKDAESALERYERLAKDHSESSLADDALYAAARLLNDVQKDPGQAREVLHRLLKDFPKGDMAGKARILASKLPTKAPKAESRTADKPENRGKGTGSSGTASRAGREKANTPVERVRSSSAQITQVQWQSRRNLARITIELDRLVNWVVYSQKPDKRTGRPDRLVVDLAGAIPDAKIKPGARVTQSLLTRLRVDLTSRGDTRILLDFSELERFEVKTETSPPRLIISVTDSRSMLKGGTPSGGMEQSSGDVGGSRSGGVSAGGTGVQSNIAAQLGLNVRTVVVDAGHGGNDPGTEHNGLIERITTLAVTKKLGEELKRMGFTVRFTRTDNQRVELSERAKMANEVKGDLFVSIHVNASTINDMYGFETYFLDFASSTAAARLAAVENAMADKNLGDMESIVAELMLGARTQESRRLATAIQTGTVGYMRKKKLAVRDGGLRSAPFHVLLGAGMPGVLVELGYCTNKTEATRLKDPEYLNALARGIAEGVKNYAARLNR